MLWGWRGCGRGRGGGVHFSCLSCSFPEHTGKQRDQNKNMCTENPSDVMIYYIVYERGSNHILAGWRLGS